jgi:RimJ/RimL family protein N-acetyltransferase
MREGDEDMANDDGGASRQAGRDAPTGDSSTAPGDLARIFGEVRTARLVLRRPHAGDGPAMFRVHGDPETNRYNPHGPHADLPGSEETLRMWLRGWEEDGYGYWAVTLPPGGEIIGFGGVRRFEWRDRDVLNLYYRFAPSAWSHGYAAEMARTAVELARTHVSGLPMVARTRPPNVPSIRTAERAGLVRRTDLDTAEHVVYALGWL